VNVWFVIFSYKRSIDSVCSDIIDYIECKIALGLLIVVKIL